jgi:hypothetical protein
MLHSIVQARLPVAFVVTIGLTIGLVTG